MFQLKERVDQYRSHFVCRTSKQHRPLIIGHPQPKERALTQVISMTTSVFIARTAATTSIVNHPPKPQTGTPSLRRCFCSSLADRGDPRIKVRRFAKFTFAFCIFRQDPSASQRAIGREGGRGRNASQRVG